MLSVLQISKVMVAMAVRIRLADKLYETFRQMIDAGEWASGTRVPPETDLAQAQGVSRPVIREALIRLKADGLIGSRGGAGNYVLSAETVEDLGYRPIENVADLIQVFEFRYSVESDIAALAALRWEDMSEIRAMATAIGNSPSEDMFGDADFRFHMALAKASRNAMFQSTLNMLRRQIVFGMRLVGEFGQSRSATRLDTVLDEHEAIVTAVASRDPTAAQTAMAAHIGMSRKRLLGFDLPAEWQRTRDFVQKAESGEQGIAKS